MDEKYVSEINGHPVKDREARERLNVLSQKIDSVINAVSTEEEMDSVLSNADDDAINSLYMYLGSTTTKYKRGGVYKLTAISKD